MPNTDSYTWIKATRKGSNVRVKVSVHSKYSQNNGLALLVIGEQKAQDMLFQLVTEGALLRNRTGYLSMDRHTAVRYVDTLFVNPDDAVMFEAAINNTAWDDEGTPTNLTGVRFIDNVPVPEKIVYPDGHEENADGSAVSDDED